MWRTFLVAERGQDIVEYSLVLVLIGATALIILTAAGANISTIFTKLTGRLNGVNDQIP